MGVVPNADLARIADIIQTEDIVNIIQTIDMTPDDVIAFRIGGRQRCDNCAVGGVFSHRNDARIINDRRSVCDLNRIADIERDRLCGGQTSCAVILRLHDERVGGCAGLIIKGRCIRD